MKKISIEEILEKIEDFKKYIKEYEAKTNDLELVMASWREDHGTESYVSAVIFQAGDCFVLWQLDTDEQGYFHTGKEAVKIKSVCKPLNRTVSFEELYPNDNYLKVLREVKINRVYDIVRLTFKK